MESDSAVVFEGRLTESHIGMEFRSCDDHRSYLLDSDRASLESFELLFQSGTSTKSIYVRFLGKVERVPTADGGVGLIRIKRIVNHSESIPPGCG